MDLRLGLCNYLMRWRHCAVHGSLEGDIQRWSENSPWHTHKWVKSRLTLKFIVWTTFLPVERWSFKNQKESRSIFKNYKLRENGSFSNSFEKSKIITKKTLCRNFVIVGLLHPVCTLSHNYTAWHLLVPGLLRKLLKWPLCYSDFSCI